MRRYLILGSILLFCVACGTQSGEEDVISFFQPQVKEHLQVLCSEALAGREAGQPGEAAAALYLAGFLQEKGLKPLGDSDTYFQAFPLKGYRAQQVGSRMVFCETKREPDCLSENVLALLEGQETGVIVLCAHYDHLGIIEGELYPGANDNASGVAVLLEMINGLVEEQPQKTLLFAFWGAEEKGLWGSRHFCEQPPLPLEQIECVLNLDTVGNLAGKELLGWAGPENERTREIVQGLAAQGWQINWEERGAHNSDHFSFAQKGIPSFTLLSPTWLDENHTPRDTVEKIKIEPLTDLVLTLLNIFK